MAGKVGKKASKFDRNKAFCKMYKDQNRRIRNKIRKLKRHLDRLPNDNQAWKALDALGKA